MSSELTRDEKQRIDDYLETAIRKDSERLFPSSITEETKVTLQKVVKRLRDLADEEKIVATYEIDCPNCERTVGRSNDKKKLAAIQVPLLPEYSWI
ncbi:MAG: hypothetical protein V1857_00745 [archaeon]